MNPHRGVNMIEPGCDIYGLFRGGPVNPDHQHSLHPVLAGSVHDLGQIIIVAVIVNMAMGIKKNHLYIPMVFPFLFLKSKANVSLQQNNQGVKV
jgi:hypothetical protein